VNGVKRVILSAFINTALRFATAATKSGQATGCRRDITKKFREALRLRRLQLMEGQDNSRRGVKEKEKRTTGGQDDNH